MGESLAVGEVVRLKSGGPSMTVEALREVQVRCGWFDKAGNLHRDLFDPATIEKTK